MSLEPIKGSRKGEICYIFFIKIICILVIERIHRRDKISPNFDRKVLLSKLLYSSYQNLVIETKIRSVLIKEAI